MQTENESLKAETGRYGILREYRSLCQAKVAKFITHASLITALKYSR